jgi:hypothetical protein
MYQGRVVALEYARYFLSSKVELNFPSVCVCLSLSLWAISGFELQALHLLELLHYLSHTPQSKFLFFWVWAGHRDTLMSRLVKWWWLLGQTWVFLLLVLLTPPPLSGSLLPCLGTPSSPVRGSGEAHLLCVGRGECTFYFSVFWNRDNPSWNLTGVFF